jgi:hypothetical protein
MPVLLAIVGCESATVYLEKTLVDIMNSKDV